MSKTEMNSLIVTLMKIILVVLAIQVGAKTQDHEYIGDFENIMVTIGKGKCHVEFLDGIIEEIKEVAPNATLSSIANYTCDEFGYDPSEVYISFESSGITIKDPQNNSKKYQIDNEHAFENAYYRKSFNTQISRAEFVKGIWSDYHFKEVKDY